METDAGLGAPTEAALWGVDVQQPPGLRAHAGLCRRDPPELGLAPQPAGPQNLVPSMATLRDPDGFAELSALCDASPGGRTMKAAAPCVVPPPSSRSKEERCAMSPWATASSFSLAIDGRTLRTNKAMGFYQLLHDMGVFGPEAPTTLRAFGTCGQLSPAQLIDRYAIVCRPVRDLLVAYLAERQPMLDHTDACGTWPFTSEHSSGGIWNATIPVLPPCAWRPRSRQPGSSA